ncbi:hypothetical protein CYMTET_30180 [Cymbomonas tetramitiformis]|uniref:Apple domain-containing protein n=1 Tax=Cymbomonas tetramitiformis TaxID=36881 RepID=A0AAE0FJC1_9CHLO|nr:hypothetical protein CYMTET_30180 [Cymbomonas tetramitiformis]
MPSDNEDDNDDGTYIRRKLSDSFDTETGLAECKRLCLEDEEVGDRCYGVEYYHKGQVGKEARCDIFTAKFTHVKKKKGRVCTALKHMMEEKIYLEVYKPEDPFGDPETHSREEASSQAVASASYVGVFAVVGAVFIIAGVAASAYKRRMNRGERTGFHVMF